MKKYNTKIDIKDRTYGNYRNLLINKNKIVGWKILTDIRFQQDSTLIYYVSRRLTVALQWVKIKKKKKENTITITNN